jgi:hypothetical protein
MVWGTTKEAGNASFMSQTSTIAQMGEAEYTQYDAAVVTGAEVINVIKLHQDDKIFVKVHNGVADKYYIYTADLSAKSGEDLANARDKGKSQYYINPNSQYTGKIHRDAATDAIIGIEFVKS